MSLAPPRVSVAIIAYRHERYIARALESALEQRAPFPIEIVVGDDASPDRTGEIIRRIASTHAAQVRAIHHTANVGGARNLAAVLAACRGEFVALLEGDDYWIEPHKLARQVEWLDRHPDCPAVCHYGILVDQDDRKIGETPGPALRPERIDLPTALLGNPMPTASLVYRRALMPQLPAWAEGLFMQDAPIAAELASLGALHVMPGFWSAYRMHGGGMWTSAGQVRQLEASLAFYDRGGRRFPHGRSREFFLRRKATLFELFRAADSNHQRRKACRWLWRYLLSAPARGTLPPHQFRAISRSLTGWPRLAPS